MSNRYPAIPEPVTTPESHQEALLATKQTIEILTGQRGGKANAAVTFQDLVDLGLITRSQIPR